jgi:hypothetical protein
MVETPGFCRFNYEKYDAGNCITVSLRIVEKSVYIACKNGGSARIKKNTNVSLLLIKV